MSLEIRDLSMEKIDLLFHQIERKAETIGNDSNTKISFQRLASINVAALTDKGLQQTIDSSAKKLGLTTKFMQSGAIHDSQEMANITRVAMIFVPSVGGISHSPKEFTKPLDLANGANVLLQTILAVDKS